jgi:hypothetical protein
MKTRVIPLLATFLISGHSVAQNFSAFGINDLSCGKYLEEIGSNPRAKEAYGWWLSGFVTGTNLEKSRETSTDVPAHNVWVKKYCEENPLLSFAKAAIELNNTLDGLAIK